MRSYIARKVFLLIALTLILAVILNFLTEEAVVSDGDMQDSSVCVIIDAGHGGEDCGAIGVNGVYEKDINLEISNILYEMLKAVGIDVIMTRTEDRLMYTEKQNIKGQRKLYDLKNRLQIANAHPNAIFVSIHMNNFSSSKYSGLQVYYSKNTESSSYLAKIIQTSVRDNLQKNNDRKIKGADSSIYLLDRAENTAVLVECGFLSNYEECNKLSEKEYQRELSFCIFCGIIKFKESQKTI